MSITSWKANHPRRVQVNDRLANQSARIEQGVASGAITRSQARALHQQDQFIRAEERGMAGFNNGHLTGADQQSLNQQLDAQSQAIAAAKKGG